MKVVRQASAEDAEFRGMLSPTVARQSTIDAQMRPWGVGKARSRAHRLRAAISLFSGMLPGGQTEAIKTELKWLTNELAPAREIRYAVEFFESVFPAKHDRKQLARLSGHLKKIQEALGSLNDFIAHQKLAADVALKTSTQNRRARAFAAGVILGREDAALKPLMKTAAKEVSALRRISV